MLTTFRPLGHPLVCTSLHRAHDPPELVEADLAVVVHVGLADHLEHLVRVELVAEQLSHHRRQLLRRDEPVVVLKGKTFVTNNFFSFLHTLVLYVLKQYF